jgi:hypothetical protein
MRARLPRSQRPGRIFEVTLDAARQAGLVGRRSVLDSTPLYDAVATMDTVTLGRSAVRGMLKASASGLAAELRGVLRRDDDYALTATARCSRSPSAAGAYSPAFQPGMPSPPARRAARARNSAHQAKAAVTSRPASRAW